MLQKKPAHYQFHQLFLQSRYNRKVNKQDQPTEPQYITKCLNAWFLNNLDYCLFNKQHSFYLILEVLLNIICFCFNFHTFVVDRDLVRLVIRMFSTASLNIDLHKIVSKVEEKQYIKC